MLVVFIRVASFVVIPEHNLTAGRLKLAVDLISQYISQEDLDELLTKFKSVKCGISPLRVFLIVNQFFRAK